MIQSKDGSNQITKAILAGIGGYFGWRALGPQRQSKILQFLDELNKAVTEAENRKREAEARIQQQRQRQAIIQALLNPPAKPTPELPPFRVGICGLAFLGVPGGL